MRSAYSIQGSCYNLKSSLIHFCCCVQVRKYDPFIVVEGTGDKLSGSGGFNDVTGLEIFS